MGESKLSRRQIRLRESTLKDLRSKPWRPVHKHYPAGGTTRLQILELPSSGAETYFEVCDDDGRWNLFTSSIVQSWYPGPLLLQGYEPVAFPSDVLKLFWTKVTSLQLPLLPDLSRMTGLDGKRTRLTVVGDRSSSNHWEWWSTPPEQWIELTSLTERMLESFKIAASPV